jgi:hypothetical protein
MGDWQATLQSFVPLTPEERARLNAQVNVAKRDDTKCVFARAQLGTLLQQLQVQYAIVASQGTMAVPYTNLYFDTPDFALYHHHHNQKFARLKMRYRHYGNTDTHVWEMKRKVNPRQTVKVRMPQKGPATAWSVDLHDAMAAQMPAHYPLALAAMTPCLWVCFTRLTLAHRDLFERVTIDLDLTYQDMAGQQTTLHNLVIVELKQPRRSLRSPLLQIARALKVYPQPFSKYCTGIALLHQPRKTNRFRSRLRALSKIEGRPLLAKGSRSCSSHP